MKANKSETARNYNGNKCRKSKYITNHTLEPGFSHSLILQTCWEAAADAESHLSYQESRKNAPSSSQYVLKCLLMPKCKTKTSCAKNWRHCPSPHYLVLVCVWLSIFSVKTIIFKSLLHKQLCSCLFWVKGVCCLLAWCSPGPYFLGSFRWKTGQINLFEN